jgi:hypothetical protein
MLVRVQPEGDGLGKAIYADCRQRQQEHGIRIYQISQYAKDVLVLKPGRLV